MPNINLNCYSGRHDIFSPLLGTRAHELKQLRQCVQEIPLLRTFELALHGEGDHSSQHLYLIPNAERTRADAYAQALFADYIAPYVQQGIREESVVDWIPAQYWAGRYGGAPGQAIFKQQDLRSGLFNWHVHVVVNQQGGLSEDGQYYLPAHIVAYHEIQHVEEGSKNEGTEEYMRMQAWNYCPPCRH